LNEETSFAGPVGQATTHTPIAFIQSVFVWRIPLTIVILYILLTIWGKWLNAEQTCIAPDYVLIHEDVKERFLQLIEEEAFKQYGKDVGVFSYVKIVSDGQLNRLSN
jgi:hypothetical protein